MSGHHTGVKPGTRVIVFMRDGNHFVAKFRKKEKDGMLEFFDHEGVQRKKIRGISPYKPNGNLE